MTSKKYKKFMCNDGDSMSRSTKYRMKKRIKIMQEAESSEESELDALIPNDDVRSLQMITDEFVVSNDNRPENFQSYEIEDCSSDLQELLIDMSSFNDDSTQNDLMKFINSENFSESIDKTINFSKGEVLLMIMQYSISHKLSGDATTSLVKFFNLLCSDKILPETKHLLDKLLNQDIEVEYHAVCDFCCGKVTGDLTQCPSCGLYIDIKTSRNTSFFVLINPSTQICHLLESHSEYYESIMNKEYNEESNFLTDIHDGKKYRQFVNSLEENYKKNYVTAIFNTDGAPKFKSSKCSIWPLYLQVNEIPPQVRMKNIVTCGLWFHKKEPIMPVFLDPFVEMINKITSRSITATINNIQRNIKLYIVNCCVDSSARGPVLGLKKYSGYYGCNFCYHPGEQANGVKYPVRNDVRLRTVEETEQILVEKEIPKTGYMGVLYPSPLAELEKFDLITGSIPDYMHACLQGVGDQVGDLLLSSIHSSEFTMIDSIMKKIFLPNQLSRLTRSLTSKSHWKAREKENFILYCSPILKLVLTKKLYTYWRLFVDSLYYLLQDKIELEYLDEIEEKLNLFVHLTQQYFGVEQMTLNVHLLTHLTNDVRNWGPLWSHSCYPFESADYQILQAIKSANGVPEQTVRYVNLNHAIFVLKEHVYKDVSPVVKSYCDNMLGKRLKKVLKINSVTYCGQSFSVDSFECRRAGVSVDSSFKYTKIIKNGCLYASKSNRQKKSLNCYAILEDNSFIKINFFIIDTINRIQLTNVQYIEVKRQNDNINKCYVFRSLIKENVYISTDKIYKVCAYIDNGKNSESYLIPVANSLHY